MSYHLSKDGEEGYPGNQGIVVTYTHRREWTLKIEYTATTDKATPSIWQVLLLQSFPRKRFNHTKHMT